VKAIKKQDFDTKIFKVPYYRIKDFNFKLVHEEFLSLVNIPNFIIDAKINANNKDWDLFLQDLGFKKICSQVELFKYPQKQKIDEFFSIKTKHFMDDKLIKKHVNNFKYDRFSLDVRINKEKRDLLYHEWIKNSITSKDIYLALNEGNFCSFKIKKKMTTIDLTSVLDHGKKIGTGLLKLVENFSYENNVNIIKVVTECENFDAYKFYKKNGFSTSSFTSCFHYLN